MKRANARWQDEGGRSLALRGLSGTMPNALKEFEMQLMEENLISLVKNGFFDKKEQLLKSLGIGGGPLTSLAIQAIRYSKEIAIKEGHPKKLYNPELTDSHGNGIGVGELDVMTVGLCMEEVQRLIQAVNMELDNSSKTLITVLNEVKSLSALLQPALMDIVTSVRQNRMALVSELNEMLKSMRDMRDIRKFFLEEEYEKEMERLRIFVDLCKDLKAQLQDGTIEAISDTMLKLAEGKGGKEDERKQSDEEGGKNKGRIENRSKNTVDN